MIKAYQGQPHQTCTFQGILFEENEVIRGLSNGVSDIIFDKGGTESLVEEFASLGQTGFETTKLSEIFSLSEQVPLDPWRIGEAFAEWALMLDQPVRFPYNPVRDARNTDASQAGADLVGFIEKENGEVVFLFGEVKTSYDKSSPPGVVYGRSGITSQLASLKSDISKVNVLVRYLGFKVKDLNDSDQFKKDYKEALKQFRTTKKAHLVGILVRDTEPNSKDLEHTIQDLTRELKENIGLDLYAYYLPIEMSEWENHIKAS